MISETTRSRNPAGMPFAEKSAGTGERADGFFREPLYPSGQGIENSARAITGARDLRGSGAGSLCICCVFLIASAIVGLAHLLGISWCGPH